MLCPISKPTKPTWLDRLRTSKNFPSSPALDLDHFLTAPTPTPNPSPNPDKKPYPNQDHLSNLITNVLAELFIMGTPPPPPPRAPRKQLHPKICLPSSSSSASGSGNNSKIEPRRCRAKPRTKRAVQGVDREEFSRTEVTVIDTSLANWKTEKIIFRKGVVWKVRDKKLWIAMRKKRKVGMVEREQSSVGPKESIAFVERHARTHKLDTSKESGDQIQNPIRRRKFSRSPRVPVANDSPLFCLQVSDPSMKNAPVCPASVLEGT